MQNFLFIIVISLSLLATSFAETPEHAQEQQQEASAPEGKTPEQLEQEKKEKEEKEKKEKEELEKHDKELDGRLESKDPKEKAQALKELNEEILALAKVRDATKDPEALQKIQSRMDNLLLRRTDAVRGKAPAPTGQSEEELRDKPFENGGIAGKGWNKLTVRYGEEKTDKEGKPIVDEKDKLNIKMLFYREGKWHPVSLFDSPGYRTMDQITNGGSTPQQTLKKGELVGWDRRGSNPFSVGVFSEDGKENKSGDFDFLVDNVNMVVTIKKRLKR